MNFNRPIILASKSPRRQQLLKMAGFDFEVVVKEVDETYPSEINPTKVAEYLSRKKADAYRIESGDHVVITADTVVKVDDQLLGKPKTDIEAMKMLQLLNNRIHEVVTGVTIKSKEQIVSFSDITTVLFGNLSAEELEHYIIEYKPYDKAGAYGIQEWIGMIGIKEIKGSYFNVVGLPIQKLYEHLKLFNEQENDKA